MTTNPRVSIRLAYADSMRRRADELDTTVSPFDLARDYKVLQQRPIKVEPVDPDNAVDDEGIAQLVRRLKAGDEVEITFKDVHTGNVKKSRRVVELSWQDLKDASPGSYKSPQVFLQAKVRGKLKGGQIVVHGGKFGVQWQPTMSTPVTPVLALRKV